MPHGCVVVALMLIASYVAAAPVAAQRPNIVLVIADDVSFDDFGCAGHPTIQTPHIDALASSGYRFVNAYLTTSSCSPTRTSIITGRYPHNTGAPELHMKSDPHLARLPQFPALLRAGGYHTAQAGKTHFNGDVTKSFDVIRGTRDSGQSGADRWVESLRERPKGQPFFMWFAARDAHRAWDMPLSQGPHGVENVVVPPYHVDGPKTREDLARYYNEVHRFDQSVGKVVEELERQDVLDSTVVIVIADNGRPFARDKTWLYDSGIRTLMVVHWPSGLPGGATPRNLVSVIDLAPTILELAGVGVPDTMQGVSLLPVFAEPSARARDFVFAEHNWHTQRAHERLVRHRHYVYIRNELPQLRGFNLVHWINTFAPSYHELVDRWDEGGLTPTQAEVFARPRPREMLFDVSVDPLQLTNLADDPKHGVRLTYLRAVLDQWIEETGDSVPAMTSMTADRVNRETWEVVLPSGRPDGGEVPGASRGAHLINASGPVRVEDFKARN